MESNIFESVLISIQLVGEVVDLALLLSPWDSLETHIEALSTSINNRGVLCEF